MENLNCPSNQITENSLPPLSYLLKRAPLRAAPSRNLSLMTLHENSLRLKLAGGLNVIAHHVAAQIARELGE